VGRYSLLGRAVRAWNNLPKVEMDADALKLGHFNNVLNKTYD
jgi:hypothetical protein